MNNTNTNPSNEEEQEYLNNTMNNQQSLKVLEETQNIGRSTLTVLQSQSETLQSARTKSHEQLQTIQQSERILRGMSSWSGWFKNLITSGNSSSSSYDNSNKYSIIVKEAVQAMDQYCVYLELLEKQNSNHLNNTNTSMPVGINLSATGNHHVEKKQEYNMNINTGMEKIRAWKLRSEVLLHQLSLSSVDHTNHTRTNTIDTNSRGNKSNINDNNDNNNMYRWLMQQKEQLDERWNQLTVNVINHNSTATNSTVLFGTKTSPTHQKYNHNSTIIQRQDEYLNNIAPGIQNLKSIGQLLNQSIEEQNTVLLNDIDKNADEADDKMKVVNRMAWRLNDRSRKILKQKPMFQSIVVIQYLPTKQYLTIVSSSSRNKNKSTNDNLNLTDEICGDASLFEMYENQGGAIGFQSMLTRKWLGLGQSLWGGSGSIGCLGSSFSSREEWEVNAKSLNQTYLLCTSANWGQGGWLVYAQDKFVAVGNDVDNKRRALLWNIQTPSSGSGSVR